ncbi:MAG TPA: hypothetical protein VGQ51_09820 [Puia sp.]|nr:hypothetical protein [Puia sp.]
MWLELYDDAKSKNEVAAAERLWNHAMELLPAYIPMFQNLVAVYEKNKNASDAMLRKLKEQIKTF